MVGGGRKSRIAAVVGGNQHQILVSKYCQKITQPCIKPVQRFRVTLRIPAVSILGVKVHQIHKAQAGKVLFGVCHGMFHTVVVAFVVDMLRQTPAGKNIVDLAHTDHIQTGIFQPVQ